MGNPQEPNPTRLRVSDAWHSNTPNMELVQVRITGLEPSVRFGRLAAANATLDQIALGLPAALLGYLEALAQYGVLNTLQLSPVKAVQAHVLSLGLAEPEAAAGDTVSPAIPTPRPSSETPPAVAAAPIDRFIDTSLEIIPAISPGEGPTGRRNEEGVHSALMTIFKALIETRNQIVSDRRGPLDESGEPGRQPS